MSLSEPLPAMARPWALDEFAAPDLFEELAPAEAPAPEAPPMDAATLEALYEERLATVTAQVEADAYARGYADGEAAARAALDSALQQALTALDAAVQSVAMHEARWIGHAEENIAALAVLVAQHVVQREIEADPSLVAGLVERALAHYPVDQAITVRLAPEDLALCRPLLDSVGRGPGQVQWVADGNVARGGCLTEGRERIIDGRVDTALERAYRALAGVHA